MRSTNPILSRPDAWQVEPTQPQGGQSQQYQGQQYQGYPQTAQPYAYGDANAPQFGQPGRLAGRMTIDDVITKSAITLGVLMAVAGVTFLFLPTALIFPVWIVTAIVSFGAAMLVAARRKVNPGFVLVYAAIEGVFIGAISKAYESLWSGIVPAAVLGTLVAAAATLAAYKFFRIRVTDKFRKMVMIGTIAYAGVLLVNLLLSLFGIGNIFASANIGLLLLISAIGVGLAVFNLILDFDFIEQGIAIGAASSESWRAAFGLTVTMVWLYIEMLRLLSYFRR
ncbi:Bax inhibitor-1/YccA family membrane protein [Propionicimonas sp.]|uniref:Bax inhibitor-1/YccA family protein n=1 Tax=Propionicimonas sp. TaxID=1955623 RepID=UPI0039E6D51D